MQVGNSQSMGAVYLNTKGLFVNREQPFQASDTKLVVVPGRPGTCAEIRHHVAEHRLRIHRFRMFVAT